MRSRILLAILSGIIIGFSAPPFDAGWLILVGMFPLLIALRGATSTKQSMVLTYIAFFVLHIIVTYWTIISRDLYLRIAGSFFLLLDPIVFLAPVYFFQKAQRAFGENTGLIALPFIWIFFEYLRTFGDLANPIFTFGNSQTYSQAILQMAHFGGVLGISFWIVTVNVLLFRLYTLLSENIRLLVRSRKVVALTLSCVAIVAIPYVYGYRVIAQSDLDEAERRSVVVGVIQPNIDPYEKWTTHASTQIQTLLSLTREITPRKPDLIIWPETAIPLYILDKENDSLYSEIRGLIDSIKIPLLTGFTDLKYYEPNDIVPPSRKNTPDGRLYDIFNAALVLQPGISTVQKYYKILVLPFFERVPFADLLSFTNLKRIRWNFGKGGYGVGKEATVFTAQTPRGDSIRWSTIICFESFFGGLVRKFVDRGAEFMVVITNDSWWGDLGEPYQHAQLAAMRAAETRRWVIRCANGGISCFVDPYGRIHKKTQLFTRASTSRRITLDRQLTPYVRYGDWPAYISGMVTMMLIATIVIRIRRAKSIMTANEAKGSFS